MFEKATRQKYRFPSTKGELTVEQLWDLPLQARGGFDLDSIAKTVNAELKSVTEESFVQTNSNPKKAPLEAKLEILKHIIKVKQEEAAAAAKRVATQEEIRKLEDVLARKSDQQLEGLSPEEIQAKLAALRS